MNDEVPVSDEQMAKCFGKYRNCGRNCRLKEVCQDKCREQQEEYNRRKFRERTYTDAMDAEGDRVGQEWKDHAPDEVSHITAEDLRAVIGELDLPKAYITALQKLIDARAVQESSRHALLDMLRKLGEVYVCDPVGFEVLFFQVLAGGNQASLARLRGCTKQNINKIVAKGKKRLEAYRQMVRKHPECRLTSREIAVYYYVAVEHCSYRQTGAFLGIGKDTVRKTALGLTEKGFSCAILTRVPRVAKIFQKIRRNEVLTNAEQAIFEVVCSPDRSLREAAKEFRCSHETVRKIRAFAVSSRQLTPGK